MCLLKNQPNAYNKIPKSTCEIPKSYHGITLKETTITLKGKRHAQICSSIPTI